MEAWLAQAPGPPRIATFAYPCDATNLGKGDANRQAARYAQALADAGIVAARTSEGLPNNPALALARPYRLQALAVGYDTPDLQSVLDYLVTAARRGHWAILVFHDIVARPNTAAGPIAASLHAQLLAAVRRLPLWCAPLGEVFERLVARSGRTERLAPAPMQTRLPDPTEARP